MCQLIPRGFEKFHEFSFDRAFTYADTRQGHRDIEKREMIRSEAKNGFRIRSIRSDEYVWGFIIEVRKAGRRPFDIENVPKLIVDAFCVKQMDENHDKSNHKELGLYSDDTIDHVQFLTVLGDRGEKDETKVCVFCKKRQKS